MTSNPFEQVLALLGKRKPQVHELKWKIPEARLAAPVEDAENTVAMLRRKARFTGGGEYTDTVYYKEYGENIYAYFTMRIDNRTQAENLLFDGYMIQEEEKLNLEVASAYSMQPYLEKLGYKKAFDRRITIWQFTASIITITVYSIEEFGDYVEVSLPPTKFIKAREAAENFALNLIEKLGIKKDDVIPIDVNTLQLLQGKEAPQESGKNLF